MVNNHLQDTNCAPQLCFWVKLHNSVLQKAVWNVNGTEQDVPRERRERLGSFRAVPQSNTTAKPRFSPRNLGIELWLRWMKFRQELDRGLLCSAGGITEPAEAGQGRRCDVGLEWRSHLEIYQQGNGVHGYSSLLTDNPRS